MPVLYYIRHGETDWNAAGRFQGNQDIHLNARGRGQASAAGAILRDLMARDRHIPAHFSYVSSPLTRARVTMDLVRTQLDLPTRGYQLDDRLREIAYGEWEGLTLPQMKARDPVRFNERDTDKWGVAPPAGESYAQLAARVSDWHRGLESDTVAVAHGGTMRALMVVTGVMDWLQAADTPVAQGVVYVFADGKMTKYA